MNKKDYWKILNHLNKKFCNNQIKINKIIFLNKIVNPNRDRGTTYGYYRMKDKTIAILKDAPTIDKIETLIHEFTHAYQHQILGEKLSHDNKGWKMFKKFKKESDKIIRISV